MFFFLWLLHYSNQITIKPCLRHRPAQQEVGYYGMFEKRMEFTTPPWGFIRPQTREPSRCRAMVDSEVQLPLSECNLGVVGGARIPNYTRTLPINLSLHLLDIRERGGDACHLALEVYAEDQFGSQSITLCPGSV